MGQVTGGTASPPANVNWFAWPATSEVALAAVLAQWSLHSLEQKMWLPFSEAIRLTACEDDPMSLWLGHCVVEGWSVLFSSVLNQFGDEPHVVVPLVRWATSGWWTSYEVACQFPHGTWMSCRVDHGRLADVALPVGSQSNGLPDCVLQGGLTHWQWHPMGRLQLVLDRLAFRLTPMPHRITLPDYGFALPLDIDFCTDVKATVRSLGVPEGVWWDLRQRLTVVRCGFAPFADSAES
jgi:hypothetical protein